MRADVDVSEVDRFARELRAAPEPVRRQLAAETAAAVNEIAAAARAKAPRERPWLSTTEGIRTSVGVVGGSVVQGSVYSPRDERGESVGYRVEYGTSEMAPQPFLMGPFRAGAARYWANVERIVGGGLER